MALVIRTTGLEDYLSGGEAYVKCLVMGEPSAGKTRAASFWPKPIFADCEKGRMSIADRKVPYGEITSTADMDKLLDEVSKECKKPVRERRFQTLVIDTVDAYQRIVIQERLDAEKKETLSGWADWGYLDAKMTQFIARLQQLPMNIVVNVHVKEKDGGENAANKIDFKLKGDLRDQIAAEFDLVGHMSTYWEAEGGERVLKRGIQWHCEPQKPMLKDRSGQLPKWTAVGFSTDDFDGLFALLIGHLDSLDASEDVQVLEDAPRAVADPVAPMTGGPVGNLAPVSQLPPARAKKATVPKAAKPAVAGAESAPVPVAPAVSPVQPEPEPETPTAVEEPTLEQAVETVQEVLGGEVTSEPTTTDEQTNATPVQAELAEALSPTGNPYCGTSSNEGEEGEPGAVAGCGSEVDPDLNITQIAMFKTRTYLCPACYTAWRATK